MEPLLIARPVLSVLLTPLYGGYRFSRLPILFFLFNSANNKDRFQPFWDTVLRQALWLSFIFLEVSYVPFHLYAGLFVRVCRCFYKCLI